MSSEKRSGFILAMVSSCTFGMIPLFSLPCLNAGMSVNSMLSFRFLVGSIGLLAVVLYWRERLAISRGELWRVTLLAAFYVASAVTMVEGYKFMPSGVATTIQFSYPIFTPLIMFAVFRERMGWRTLLALVLAVLGVTALAQSDGGSGEIQMTGVVLELLAGLTYAIYLVMVPKMKLSHLSDGALTFWIFFMSMILMGLWTMLHGDLDATPLKDGYVLLNLVLLGLIPTALSNITLILALKRIGSTLSAILGALEPLTAMCIGVLWLCEPFTLLTAAGAVAIIASVMLLVLR
ncbi:MAG: DMT family transporter [Muribaculaceae bacterium]|nr:DMT family transporter [Muribaculaceae bacterium]